MLNQPKCHLLCFRNDIKQQISELGHTAYIPTMVILLKDK